MVEGISVLVLFMLGVYAVVSFFDKRKAEAPFRPTMPKSGEEDNEIHLRERPVRSSGQTKEADDVKSETEDNIKQETMDTAKLETEDTTRSERIEEEVLPQLPVSEVVEEILKGLHCEYSKSEYQGWADRFVFRYQNGTFMVTANKSGLDFRIFYPGMLCVETDQWERVAEVCNDFSYRSLLYKAYTRYDEQEHRLMVDLIVDGDFRRIAYTPAKDLQYLMESAFSAHRQFVDLYEKRSQEIESIEQKEEYCREDYLQEQHQELRHGRQSAADLQAGSMSLLNLWSMTHERWLLKDPERLTIVTESVDIITDLASIQRQDVIRPLMERRLLADGDKPRDMTYLLKYHDENVAVTTELLEEEENEATLMLTMASDWVNPAPDGSYGEAEHPIRILVTYDKRTQEEQYAEFSFMASEADETDSPTPAQAELQGQTDKPWAEALYWGTKAFLEQKLGTAIYHLEKVYDDMKKTFHDMPEREKSVFQKVIYRLGYCYNEVGLYKQAYYYLNGIFGTGNFNNNMEYINTLAGSEDWRAESVIAGEMDYWYHWCKENKEHESIELVLEYMHFLSRKRVLLHIQQKRLKEAREQLEIMLDDERDAEFAREKLDYIQRLDKEETNPASIRRSRGQVP